MNRVFIFALLPLAAFAHPLIDASLAKYKGVAITQEAQSELNEAKVSEKELEENQKHMPASVEQYTGPGSAWSRGEKSYSDKQWDAWSARNASANEELKYRMTRFEAAMDRAKESQGAAMQVAYAKQYRDNAVAESRAKTELEAKQKKGALDFAVGIEASRPAKEAALAEFHAGKITRSEALTKMRAISPERAAIVAEYRAGKLGYDDAMARLKGQPVPAKPQTVAPSPAAVKK